MLDLVRRRPQAFALAAYVVMSIAATWPLAARFATDIAGDGPAWDTLWGLWWWADSVSRRASPFFCDALRWPAGVSLWPHASNVPAATLLAPLWLATPHVPEVSIYNAVVLASYPVAGFTAFLLSRELWGSQLAAFLAGALYTFSAHHLRAAAGPLDAVSIEWLPLYLLGLVRTVRRHGPVSPLLGGAALAVAAATSPYHLASCAICTAVLMAGWWRTERCALTDPAFARRAVLLLATFVALAGWLYVAGSAGGPARSMGLARSGAADLVSFFVPGPDGWWAIAAGWGLAGGTGAAYVGYVGLALAVVAALRAKASRPWIAIAAIGLVLALGARLHVGGRPLTPAVLPWAWIGHLLPAFAVADAARFDCLVVLGISVGGGAALALLVRARRRGAAVAVAVTALALVETWPGALRTSSWPAPRFLRDLAKDGERWAVLDTTAPERQLWHQVLHHHPQVGAALGSSVRDLGAATGSAVVDALVARHAAMELAPVQRQDAVRALQQMNVRFVIADRDTLGPARALHLPRAWAGEGIVIFEVPPRTG